MHLTKHKVLHLFIVSLRTYRIQRYIVKTLVNLKLVRKYSKHHRFPWKNNYCSLRSGGWARIYFRKTSIVKNFTYTRNVVILNFRKIFIPPAVTYSKSMSIQYRSPKLPHCPSFKLPFPCYIQTCNNIAARHLSRTISPKHTL